MLGGDASVDTAPGMIGTAASESGLAAGAWRRREASRRRMRRRVEAIDEVLDALEHMHLVRDRVISRLVRARLRRLEEEVGLPLPRRVARARNTVRLHAALLDWQDVVLDEVIPGRRRLLEEDDRSETPSLDETA